MEFPGHKDKKFKLLFKKNFLYLLCCKISYSREAETCKITYSILAFFVKYRILIK